MITVKIVTPSGLYAEKKTSILNVTSMEGQLGILPNHVPLVTMLAISKMNLQTEQGKEEYALAGGMLYFKENVATILTDAIEKKEDIDIDRAKAALQRAEERLQRNHENDDHKRAEIALKKAMNRVNW